MNEKTHIDLFSGIGGFALAARANGIRTVCFCECNPDCRDFLGKAWPGVAQHEDVRKFDGRRYTGAFLLTGGVPCQPASRAGKQGGRADDRWLWGEAVRVLAEVRPTWAVFENPAGIADVGLDGILADVGRCGYEIGLADIPACAVGAPHGRARFWIICRRIGVADADEQGRQGADAASGADGLCAEHCQGELADAGRIDGGEDEQERGPDRRTADRGAGGGGVGDAEHGAGRTGQCAPQPGGIGRGRSGDASGGVGAWDDFVWLPCADGKVRRAPDDAFLVADGVSAELLARQVEDTHRSILAAFGNSIVWQVAAEVIAAIVGSEKDE